VSARDNPAFEAARSWHEFAKAWLESEMRQEAIDVLLPLLPGGLAASAQPDAWHDSDYILLGAFVDAMYIDPAVAIFVIPWGGQPHAIEERINERAAWMRRYVEQAMGSNGAARGMPRLRNTPERADGSERPAFHSGGVVSSGLLLDRSLRFNVMRLGERLRDDDWTTTMQVLLLCDVVIFHAMPQLAVPHWLMRGPAVHGDPRVDWILSAAREP
jgi:hypothetical protein